MAQFITFLISRWCNWFNLIISNSISDDLIIFISKGNSSYFELQNFYTLNISTSELIFEGLLFSFEYLLYTYTKCVSRSTFIHLSKLVHFAYILRIIINIKAENLAAFWYYQVSLCSNLSGSLLYCKCSQPVVTRSCDPPLAIF